MLFRKLKSSHSLSAQRTSGENLSSFLNAENRFDRMLDDFYT